MNLKFIAILTLLISAVCRADDDNGWAADLSNSTTKAVWKHLKQQFEEQEQLALGSNLDPAVLERAAELYIFVSTSMPKPLLKNYFKEARKYEGIVVFKGLPNGSFKELAKLIRELVDDRETQAAVQIDDEAFEKFGVTEVPSIVLSSNNEYNPNQSAALTYDKITGNVGIRYALEQFESSGELAKEVKKYLQNLGR